MPGRSIRICRIAGIPVGISPWWLVIVALITWSLGESYYPDVVHGIAPAASYGLGLASALLLFASVLAHEFGHALVARRHGIAIEEIDLWLLGGVARMSGHPTEPGDELRFALAGPAVTAVVAAVFGALAVLLPHTAPSGLRALIGYQAEVNGLILLFNMLPAFPLDGGRVARALLWKRRGDMASATATAAALGRGFGYLMIGGGVLLAMQGAAGGLWLVVIGVFLAAAATAERQQEEIVARFAGVSAAELMTRPAISIPGWLTAVQAQEYFTRYRHTAFPVTDEGGRAVGILDIGALERTRPAERFTARAGDLAERDPTLIVGRFDDVSRLLEQPAFLRVGRAAVVDETGHPIGIVSVTDIQRALRASRLGGQ